LLDNSFAPQEQAGRICFAFSIEAFDHVRKSLFSPSLDNTVALKGHRPLRGSSPRDMTSSVVALMSVLLLA
jgi:hypothetical protein